MCPIFQPILQMSFKMNKFGILSIKSGPQQSAECLSSCLYPLTQSRDAYSPNHLRTTPLGGPRFLYL